MKQAAEDEARGEQPAAFRTRSVSSRYGDARLLSLRRVSGQERKREAAKIYKEIRITSALAGQRPVMKPPEPPPQF